MAEEGLCNREYNGKNVGKHYCPYSCGHCDDDDNHHSDNEYFCFRYDNEDFRYDGKDWKVSNEIEFL